MIAILDYGSGNLHSVSRAIARVGGEPVVTGDSEAFERADAVVIPGVGHFGACVRAIASRGLADAVCGWAERARPIFGVCVGMQVLMRGSEEDDEPGLAILEGRSRRLPPTVKVPHMGWNTVAWGRDHPYTAGIPTGTRFYFVHSFAPDIGVDTIGTTEHGRPFSSAIASGQVFATQFHPEKSGEAGLHLYENFVKAVSA